jgi:hypothetical protein
MNLHMKTLLRAIIQYHNVPIPALKLYAMSKNLVAAIYRSLHSVVVAPQQLVPGRCAMSEKENQHRVFETLGNNDKSHRPHGSHS